MRNVARDDASVFSPIRREREITFEGETRCSARQHDRGITATKLTRRVSLSPDLKLVHRKEPQFQSGRIHNAKNT